ncbi:hypothetical protein MAHJHV59_47320 [Mycobacterium avium subsp. hominissuis]
MHPAGQRTLQPPGGADHRVPRVAAGRLQGALAGWVHRHGLWPWALALLALAAVLFGRAHGQSPCRCTQPANAPCSRPAARAAGRPAT